MLVQWPILHLMTLFHTGCPNFCKRCTYNPATSRTECPECDAGYTLKSEIDCKGKDSKLNGGGGNGSGSSGVVAVEWWQWRWGGGSGGGVVAVAVEWWQLRWSGGSGGGVVAVAVE